MIALLLACAVEAAPDPGVALELYDTTLQLGAVQVQAQLAQVSDGGDGSAQGVSGRLDASSPMEITATRSSWDLRERTVSFEGDVVAWRDDVRMSCDQLVVRYASAQRVDTATAIGHVVVRREQRRASAGRAVLSAATGQIVLTEQPTVSDGPNRMTGERIVMWLDDERVECEACHLVIAGDAVAPQGAHP